MSAQREGLECPRCGSSADDQDKRYFYVDSFFVMSCRSCRYEWKYQLPKKPAQDGPLRR